MNCNSIPPSLSALDLNDRCSNLELLTEDEVEKLFPHGKRARDLLLTMLMAEAAKLMLVDGKMTVSPSTTCTSGNLLAGPDSSGHGDIETINKHKKRPSSKLLQSYF
jgi:hypothetical protein